jgi:hypothetical protein
MVTLRFNLSMAFVLVLGAGLSAYDQAPMIKETIVGVWQWQEDDGEQAVAPDRGGMTVFRDATPHQPPRQVNGVVRVASRMRRGLWR